MKQFTFYPLSYLHRFLTNYPLSYPDSFLRSTILEKKICHTLQNVVLYNLRLKIFALKLLGKSCILGTR